MSNPEIKNDVSLLLALEAGQQMLEKLSWVKLVPDAILLLGGGGFASILRERYPRAVLMEAEYLKLETIADQSADLIFANLILPWTQDIKSMLAHWHRILRPQSLLVFTSLGPDTLRGVAPVDLIPQLMDMHDLGDMLVHGKFAEPIMDLGFLTLNYRNKERLTQELQLLGMIRDADAVANLPVTSEGVIPAVFEIVHGHAWRPTLLAEQTADEFGTVRIPLSHLRRPR